MARRRKNKKNIFQTIITTIIIVCIISISYIVENDKKSNEVSVVNNAILNETIIFDISTIPNYNSKPYIEINNNIPYLNEDDYTTKPFETYSELDYLGRSGVAFANICTEIMPKEGEEREDIGNIKDLSGWIQKRYDNIIKDKYLYNRCHLIGWQLSGENANKENLFTGTRYLNTEGMLPFENKIDDYIEKNENNHVLYRVTPIFEGNNLLATGVELEAWSVEDNGEGICFNVYCYNVQPGIVIDYATGESHLK